MSNYVRNILCFDGENIYYTECCGVTTFEEEDFYDVEIE